MERRLSIGSLALLSLLATGCYESRDAPPAAFRDAGERPQLDGAVPAEDAAVALDAGLRDGGGAVLDAARPACGDVVAPFVGPGCGAPTRECIAGCDPDDGACVDECIAGDGQCVLCVDTTLVRCANEAGCQSAWDGVACCAKEQPLCAARSGLSLLACAEACDEELFAYDECVSAVGERCLEDVVVRCGLAP